MKKVSVTIVVLLLSAVGFAQTFPKSTHEIFPVSVSMFVPCANGGAGELVDLSGSLDYLLLWNASGSAAGWTVTGLEHFRQHVIGRGDTTGIQYQGLGMENLTFKQYPPQGQVSAYVNNFTVVGGGVNFVVHTTLKFQITPDGNLLIVAVDNFNAQCN